MEIDSSLFSFFYMLMSSYDITICCFLFSIIVCFFVKNYVFIGLWINIWFFNSGTLVLLSVLMPIPGCFQYCSSVVEFGVSDFDGSRSSFIIQNYFGYSVFLLFHITLSTIFSRSVKNFAGHYIESVDCFW